MLLKGAAVGHCDSDNRERDSVRSPSLGQRSFSSHGGRRNSPFCPCRAGILMLVSKVGQLIHFSPFQQMHHFPLLMINGK